MATQHRWNPCEGPRLPLSVVDRAITASSPLRNAAKVRGVTGGLVAFVFFLEPF
jgi:hypothetical protein